MDNLFTPAKKRRKRRKWIGQKGGLRPSVKLTKEQVMEIWCLLYEGKLKQVEIAKMFDVTQETISHIATGTRWNEVTGLPRRTKQTASMPPSGYAAGRPRHNYLKSLRKPRKADLSRLVDGCVMAILRGEARVNVKLPTMFKFPVDWPRAFLVRREDRCKVYGFNAKKMLTWLHENEYTAYSVKEVLEVNSNFSMLTLLGGDDFGLGLFKDVFDN